MGAYRRLAPWADRRETLANHPKCARQSRTTGLFLGRSTALRFRAVLGRMLQLVRSRRQLLQCDVYFASDYIAFIVTIGFTVFFPDVVLFLPKWLLPESVGCFRNPAGSGYICP